MSNHNNNTAFQMIADVDGDLSDLIKMNVPSSVPILAVRNLVLFPGVVSPILIGRDSSKKLVQKAEKMGLINAENKKLVLEWLRTPWTWAAIRRRRSSR